VATSAATPSGAPPRAGRRRVLAVLCLTELVSWGVLYYAFPVLAPWIAADTGWSPAELTAAFSAGLAAAAVVGVPVGRRLDRWGPQPVMTVGSVLAVAAVLVMSQAASYAAFLAGWLLAGTAMAGVLYPPAVAAVTRWWTPQHVPALTALTVAGGLASTVFAPLTAAIAQRSDWRTALLALAVVLAVLTVPAHLVGLRGPWPAASTEIRPGGEGAPRRIVRGRPFVLLAAALTLAAFSVYAVLVNLVPLLLERGLTTSTAALALGLGGVGQVAARLGYVRLVAATTVRARTVLVLAAGAAGTALLAAVPGPAAVLITLSVAVGATRGVHTLLQSTAVSDRWGAAHFGRLNGVLGAPLLLAAALAPWAGSALARVFGSYAAVFAVLAAIGAVAVLLAAVETSQAPQDRRMPRRSRSAARLPALRGGSSLRPTRERDVCTSTTPVDVSTRRLP
jgi:MFS family permease